MKNRAPNIWIRLADTVNIENHLKSLALSQNVRSSHDNLYSNTSSYSSLVYYWDRPAIPENNFFWKFYAIALVVNDGEVFY